MLIRETPVFIDGPVGQLEALYLDVADARGVVLLCHPNPVQGGTMMNKVVSMLQRTARDAGYITLRFNYRGVGQSAGSHDMGSGEVDDAQAAVDWLREQHPALPLTLMGFSFGGFVAASLGGRLEARGVALKHLFMVAPAVMRLGDNPLPQQGELSVIQPETDEVIDPQIVYDWSDALPRPHELLKVAECGHFFHGKLTDLKELVLPRLSN
ncbi:MULTISPECIES: alpha/beta fold hydrolase [Pseudomonas]|uniref:Alpha/beta fold hydrolase n=1 Tax=Pseudomonas donghuensis TaxID=1163398 RepID=A0AAP0SC11_9PSED|nr:MULTISPECIES: alpha/beta fold hydrolase [Pseudomonas]MDF9895242.1 alpha/beta superfamily hydrolase [Pseudomonas vranovensis]KDN97803.1 alpha/beta fold hydrolase [Pseudomonas donghuensis]MBF4206902.1 alpha/beta fold hydrolase [Pseudomonas donghuensis]MBS7597701.1 alpha/beta fold hydrolase [Pseudomonas sp. RC2C2]MCP6690768.1 alpha/beta fold hydrolase [Pseudomonas donghuensis]